MPRDKFKKLAYNRHYTETHKEQVASSIKRREHTIKLAVMTYYGNGIPACVICGTTILNLLVIDHIHGDGNKHRAEIKASSGGIKLYRWLMRNNYPPGFQTLCLSCNSRKTALNYHHPNTTVEQVTRYNQNSLFEYQPLPKAPEPPKPTETPYTPPVETKPVDPMFDDKEEG